MLLLSYHEHQTDNEETSTGNTLKDSTVKPSGSKTLSIDQRCLLPQPWTKVFSLVTCSCCRPLGPKL